jgi:hypothetical protein
MSPRQLEKKVNHVAGLIEGLDYEFYSQEHEEAASRALVASILCLNEFQSIVERDEVVRELEKI